MVKWEACEDPRELGRQAGGAVLLGIGGVISIGQGFTAFAPLAWSGPVTLAAIVSGALLGLRQLIAGYHPNEPPLFIETGRDWFRPPNCAVDSSCYTKAPLSLRVASPRHLRPAGRFIVGGAVCPAFGFVEMAEPDHRHVLHPSIAAASTRPP
jgi:hypothetical protein